jgi:hypothetical protein
LFKFKEGENFNHRNTLSILRIALKLHFVQNVEPDPREIGSAFHGAGTETGQKGAFCKGLSLCLSGWIVKLFNNKSGGKQNVYRT